jgi:hypothetical protein
MKKNICCGEVRRLETAESGLNRRKPRFGHKIAVRRYRPVRSSAVPLSSSFTKARLTVGYRCCNGPCLDLRAWF